MSWQILILTQTVLVAASTICLRILARNNKTAKASFAVNAIMYAALYASFLFLVPFLGHVHSYSLSEYWWRFILGGTAFALTNVFTYKTLVYFDAAIASIAGTVNAMFTIILAALILGEKLSKLQFVGSVILIIAICFGILATHAVRKKTVRDKVKLGVIYALLAGMSFSIAAVNEKSLLSHMTIGSYAVYGIGGQFIMSVLTALIIQPKQLLRATKPDVASWSLLAGVLRGFGGACFIFAEVKSNNVALVSVIANFKLIIVILLGWWLLNERGHIARKLVSALIAISGLVVMFWS